MRPKLLAIDYGTRRIGVAVSSPLGTVHPRPHRERVTPESDVAFLAALADEEEVTGIVIGLPHHMDGAQSEMEVQARSFAEKLAQACGLPVFGSDERLTSQEAERILAVQHKSPRQPKGRVDSAAACILLQDFLAADNEPERIA